MLSEFHSIAKVTHLTWLLYLPNKTTVSERVRACACVCVCVCGSLALSWTYKDLFKWTVKEKVSQIWMDGGQRPVEHILYTLFCSQR